MTSKESIIDVMLEVGLAIYGGGNPIHRLRIAKNNSKLGTSTRRTFEVLMKQDKNYLQKAADEALRIKEQT